MIRLYAIIAAIVALLGVVGWATWNHEAAKREKALRVAAEAQGQVAQATTQIVEKTFTNERVIYRQAEASTDAIQAAEGADAPIPADVRNALCDGLGRLRDAPQCGDNPGSRPAAGGL